MNYIAWRNQSKRMFFFYLNSILKMQKYYCRLSFWKRICRQDNTHEKPKITVNKFWFSLCLKWRWVFETIFIRFVCPLIVSSPLLCCKTSETQHTKYNFVYNSILEFNRNVWMLYSFSTDSTFSKKAKNQISLKNALFLFLTIDDMIFAHSKSSTYMVLTVCKRRKWNKKKIWRKIKIILMWLLPF